VRGALRNVPASYREAIDDGDIYKQTPAPGTVLASDLTGPFPAVTFYVYDQALDFKGKRCPYGDAAKRKTLLNGIDGEELGIAEQILEDAGCKHRILKEFETKTATDSRIYSSTLIDTKTKKGRDLGIGLVVERPRRKDFVVNVMERPAYEWKANKGLQSLFKKEIGLGTDGKLTAGLAPAVLHIDLTEAATGLTVTGQLIEIVQSGTGKVLGSSKTNTAGGVTFTVPVDWTGELDVHVRYEGKGTSGMGVLESWGSIPVVYRADKKPFYTNSGRYFTWQKDRYVQTAAPKAASAVLAKVETTMEGMLAGVTTPLAQQALAALSQASGTPQSRLQEAFDNFGLTPGKLLSGGTTDGTFNAPQLGSALGTKIVNGIATLTPIAGAKVPKTGDVGVANITSLEGTLPIVGGKLAIGPGTAGIAGSVNAGTALGILSHNGSQILSHNGAVAIVGQKLIGNDGSTLIGNDGSTLIGNDGSTLIGNDGSTLVQSGFAALIGMDGST
jgi:hypothetical protein